MLDRNAVSRIFLRDVLLFLVFAALAVGALVVVAYLLFRGIEAVVS